MKVKKNLFLLIICIFPVFNLFGINFHGLNLSSDDRLLFKAEFEPQNMLFISSLANRTIYQLTAFPEKLQIIDNGRTILAINRFGAARIPTTGGLPAPVLGYPSFAEGNVPLRGKTQELSASADGRWLLYIEPTSPAFGNLILAEIASGNKWVISERVELSASDFPAKWSPDSRLFVYAKSGNLFYVPIISDLSVLIDERFRMIGSGGINSVFWGQQGDFYYYQRNTLYRVINPELFTRTIYGDFLSIGSVAAAFPLEFDPGFDRYWVAPDSGAILISKAGKSLSIFLLDENQDSSAVLPYITIPDGSENFNVFWSNSGQLAIISSLQNKITIWRFEITGNQIKNLITDNVPASSNGVMSPDGSKIVFWGESGIELWDYNRWQLIQRLSQQPVFSCAWINNTQLISGNSSFIEEITISGANYSNRQICLSGVDEFGFEAGSRSPSRILARIETRWFATDGANPWIPVNNPQLQKVSLINERYRVFLESQSSGHFNNIPMIRSVYSSVTIPLVSNHSANGAYTLGRKIQAGLCFDLYDDDTGLYQVLAALRRYNIRATFFLNGDFIRRNPVAAAVIAEAGHEVGSLFFAPVDFSNSRYQITQEFIIQGLARNEDEFFHATGKELSPLWHSPFYRSSNLITTAAAAAGYITVQRTIDPGDWMSREEAVRLNLRQNSASQMIEQIIEKRTANAIIPIRLGLHSGGRDDYLFQRIDVLLDALLRSGIEIVPVSAVIDR